MVTYLRNVYVYEIIQISYYSDRFILSYKESTRFTGTTLVQWILPVYQVLFAYINVKVFYFEISGFYSADWQVRRSLYQICSVLTGKRSSQQGRWFSGSCTYSWAESWENLFMLYANNKGADQTAHPRSLISAFVVHCLDSMIPLVSISEISSLYLASVAAQACLCLSWSQTPKTGVLITWLSCNDYKMSHCLITTWH